MTTSVLARLPESGEPELLFLLFHGVGANADGMAPLAMRLRALNLAVWHRLFFEEAGRPGRVLGHGMLRETAA